MSIDNEGVKVGFADSVSDAQIKRTEKEWKKRGEEIESAYDKVQKLLKQVVLW